MSHYDPRFYVRPVSFGRRWQNDYYPDHPDVSKLAAEDRRRTDALADWDGELPDDADYEAAESAYMPTCTGNHMWGKCDRDECDFERPLISHRHRGCGHECDSLACYRIAGLKDSQCLACQLGEADSRGPSRGMNERKP